MRRTAAAVLIALATAGWWLFGFSIERMGPSTLRMHRWFGRVVRAEMDRDGDGRVEQAFLFSWRIPMEPHQRPLEVVTDSDRDGRWDVWTIPRDGDRATYRVDTNGDGRPDWTFHDRWHSPEAWAKIRARRGF